MFSNVPDGGKHLLPDSVSQRYSDLVRRLGIHTSIHKLRHCSATELISVGVNPRTVAGRLGHGGGGTTTLRYYTARPEPGAAVQPSCAPHPYERVAALLRLR